MADVWQSLCSLEDRLKYVEKRIYQEDPSLADPNKKVIDVVFEVQKRLKDAEAKTPILGMLFKQLKVLDEYLSAEFYQRINLTTEATSDVVACAEEQIKDSARKLEEIDSMKHLLNENKLTDVPQWNKKLEPLVQVQIQQNTEVEELSLNLTQLLSAYNNIILSISKQFVEWENVVTHCEIAVDTAKAANEN